MLVPGLFITFSLLILALTLGSNFLFFPRLRVGRQEIKRPLKPTDLDGPRKSLMPSVSVLIPARNEARVIGRTVSQLLAQDYPHLDIHLLDDQSEDGTGEVARHAAAADPRFHLHSGQPLPPGWLGKNWACHQLAQVAQGEILLFLDADVQCQPTAITALVDLMENEQAAAATIWPTQITHTWGERLVVPLMAWAILAYLPVVGVHYSQWAAFAAANGQCLALRRKVYQVIGGHEAVRNNVVEDVALARLVKQHQFRLRMADGAGLILCRMYENWGQVRAGFAKNILAGHGNSILFLAVSTLFHGLIFIVPWLWWLGGGGLWPLMLALAGLLLRGLTAWFTRQRLMDTIFMPLSVGLMTIIAGQSVIWRLRGRGQWKGRTLS
ncbi:MAG: glycosyltransferase [Chloroflexi bacterium]|nr:glycosyltransferase [Chloroflexota bacterium]